MRAAPPPMLADLLRESLAVVFIGINPSIYSANHGHYFARPSNRFWPCFSSSRLSGPARAALGVERLGPEHDRALLAHGIGFTDVAKAPTVKATDLPSSELAAGVADLLEKIERFRPRVACFHGITGFRHVHRRLTDDAARIELGAQRVRVGATRLYLVPNPSGANAHFTRADQTRWYDALAASLAGAASEPP